MKTRCVFLFCCPAVALLLAGCTGGDIGSVSGRVTLNGEPLKGASVEFQPVAGKRPSIGETDEDGNYTLQYTMRRSGAEVGEHEVRVSLPIVRKDRDGEDQVVGDRVPANYNAQTELRKTVEPGSNEIDFELQGQPWYGRPDDPPPPAATICGPVGPP